MTSPVRSSKKFETKRVPDKKKVLILASGGGSNADAILEAFKGDETVTFKIGCNRTPEKAGVYKVAEKHGVEIEYVPSPKQDFSKLEILFNDYRPDMVVLAGYTRVLPSNLVSRFPKRMINIHPAVCGRHDGCIGYADTFGDKDIGAGSRVHYVIPAVDKGPVMAEAYFLVTDGTDSLDKLSAIGLAVEHAMYPEAVRAVLSGRKIDADGIVWEARKNLRDRNLPQVMNLTVTTENFDAWMKERDFKEQSIRTHRERQAAKRSSERFIISRNGK